jgi:mannose-6-phosphate isomerase-like protein (cupin superfamily)
VTQPTPHPLQSRLVRYADLRPCRNAFIDSRTPGSEQKENFTIIGPGVAESPDQHVHVSIPHGFNIGGARQPPRCVNSQHSHDTAEVFIVLSGTWAFRSGELAKDGEIILGPGDVISLPIHMFRGFENVGADVGFLFAVLGGDDPGRVMWAPYVFEAARTYGLVLLENGRLIDTTQGQRVPEGARIMAPTSPADIARMTRYTSADLTGIVQRAVDMVPAHTSLLAARADGALEENAIVGGPGDAEGLPAGKMAWSHGFHLRRFVLAPGSALPAHARAEEEVLLMHRGTLRFEDGHGAIDLGAGDCFSVPRTAIRRYSNPAAEPAVVYVVRGGDHPSAPEWAV